MCLVLSIVAQESSCFYHFTDEKMEAPQSGPASPGPAGQREAELAPHLHPPTVDFSYEGVDM